MPPRGQRIWLVGNSAGARELCAPPRQLYRLAAITALARVIAQRCRRGRVRGRRPGIAAKIARSAEEGTAPLRSEARIRRSAPGLRRESAGLGDAVVATVMKGSAY